MSTPPRRFNDDTKLADLTVGDLRDLLADMLRELSARQRAVRWGAPERREDASEDAPTRGPS